MTAPNPQPQPKPKSRRKVVLLLGCVTAVFGLVLVGVAVMMFVLLKQERQNPVALPRSWREDLRAARQLPPEAERFRPPKADSGNAAVIVFGPGRRPPSGRAVAVIRVARDNEIVAEDRDAVREAAADTSLDAALRAARMREYRIVPLLLADTSRPVQFFGVTMPEIFPRRGSAYPLDGLVLRGFSRARAGRLAAAREDLRAAIGLGLMMYEREPTWAGSRRGLQVVRYAAQVLASAERRDTAAAAAATRLRAWAERQHDANINVWRGLYRNRDSAFAAIADTTLPFNVRAEALYSGSVGAVLRNPWRVFRGPSRAEFRRLREVQRWPDPDLAALAVAADTVLTRMDRVGAIGRLRAMRRQR